MKTIFITSFEGLETKNVLRTAILPTIVESGVKVVLLVQSRERMAYHKREFGERDIAYELVDQIRVTGLDGFFQFLKFLLLRSETMILRKKMKYEIDRSAIAYYGGLIASRILAHSSIRRIARALDLALVKNVTYDALFERYKPDLVLLSNLFNEPEVHMLRAAKKYGVRSVGFINSWDKVSGRCILRLLPDKLVVFNDIVKEEAMRYDDMPEKDIFVGGLPQYDPYFGALPFSSRQAFFEHMGLDPGTRLILYAPVGAAFSDSDWDMIDLVYAMRDQGAFGDKVSLLMRFPPNEQLDMHEVEKRPFLKYDYPGIRFSSERGSDWDMTASDIRHLADTLRHMSLLVCFASSLSIDAAVFDKPVINLNFEVKKNQHLLKSPTQYYGTAHYQKALRAGGIRLAGSREELAAWVVRYLADPSLDREGRKTLVAEQCHFQDGKSGVRIGNFVLDLLMNDSSVGLLNQIPL